jgi:hypothetical protein
MNQIKHPVEIGKKTNIGTIRSYKLVKYGIGKYRYFVKENEESFKEEDIIRVY